MLPVSSFSIYLSHRDANPNSDLSRDRHHYFKDLTHSSIEIRLVEGRNRQIRRMVEGLGYKVLALHRTDFCQLTLSGLKEPTDWCTLNREELDKIVGIAKVNHQLSVEKNKASSNGVVSGVSGSSEYSSSDSDCDGLEEEYEDGDEEEKGKEIEGIGGV
jgi:hypothetical protein